VHPRGSVFEILFTEDICADWLPLSVLLWDTDCHPIHWRQVKAGWLLNKRTVTWHTVDYVWMPYVAYTLRYWLQPSGVSNVCVFHKLQTQQQLYWRTMRHLSAKSMNSRKVSSNPGRSVKRKILNHLQVDNNGRSSSNNAPRRTTTWTKTTSDWSINCHWVRLSGWHLTFQKVQTDVLLDMTTHRQTMTYSSGLAGTAGSNLGGTPA